MEKNSAFYEISAEGTEIVLKINTDKGNTTTYMQMNQAFAFINLFLTVLGRVASSLGPSGAMSAWVGKVPPEGEQGGSTPASGGATQH